MPLYVVVAHKIEHARWKFQPGEFVWVATPKDLAEMPRGSMVTVVRAKGYQPSAPEQLTRSKMIKIMNKLCMELEIVELV
jgi:hypothetical protein